ncbi:hypothetical protein ACWYXO_05625 [Janthinobacterium aestuarii]
MEHSNYNPFTMPLAAASAQFARNATEYDYAHSTLAWYEAASPDALHASLQRDKRVLTGVGISLQASRTALSEHDLNITQLKQAIPSIWHLLSTERKVAVRMHDEAVNQRGQLVATADRLALVQESTVQKIREQERELVRYRSFDPLQAQAKLALIPAEQAHLTGVIADLTVKEQKVAADLAPMLAQLYQLDQEETSLIHQIGQANAFDQALSRESDGRARRVIHEQCDRLLGNAKPRAAAAMRERKLKGVRATKAKVKERLELVARRHSMNVQTLVIDGSNLLYANKSNGERSLFGLSALDALVPELVAKDKKVIVYFDHGAPNLLRKTPAELRRRFARWTDDVHIAAPGEKADESILATVDLDPHSYVISGDRFRDHVMQYDWLRDRLLTPHLTSERLFLHALDIHLSLKPAP